MNECNKTKVFLLRFINSVKNALCHLWSDNCANCYFQSFVVSLLFPFADFFIFYRRQKKKWKKAWKKTFWKNCIELGMPLKIEKKKSKEIFLLSQSFVRSFLILILTFWKGQQKNWCFLVLHRMTIFLTMNIFSENYDAFTEMGRFNEIVFEMEVKTE